MRYSFDEFVLDLDRRELHKGSEAVDLEPQVFDLLAFLLHHRDRVVSRDDLIAGVWGGRIVSESTLASRINAARRAIGDDGSAQRLIKTIVRKGFRFVGEVREDTAARRPRAGCAPLALKASASAALQRWREHRGGDGRHGPILVKTANWLNHLEHDWQSPIWSPMLQRSGCPLPAVRYDGRGNGLSDRDVADISSRRICARSRCRDRHARRGPFRTSGIIAGRGGRGHVCRTPSESRIATGPVRRLCARPKSARLHPRMPPPRRPYWR